MTDYNCATVAHEHIVYRSWISPYRQRRIVQVVACIIALYILTHVGVGLAGYPVGPWPPPWYLFVLPWLVIPLVLLQYRCEEVRMVVRIDEQGIAYARFNSPRRPPRRMRQRLRWSQIDRVRLGNGSIALSGNGKMLALAQRVFPPAQWEEMYLSIALYLEQDFDLITPTPAQLRFERVQNRTRLRFAGEMALLSLVGIGINVAIGAWVVTMNALAQWQQIIVGVGLIAAVPVSFYFVRNWKLRRDGVNWRERRR